MTDRREFLRDAASSVMLGGAAAASASASATNKSPRPRALALDLNQRTAQDDLLIWARLKADLSGRITCSMTSGTVWGFKPQADDLALKDFAKRLYGYATCILRSGSALPDGRISIRARSWNFYLHPETNQPVSEVLNPYTGTMVPCAPMIAPAREQLYTVDGAVMVAPTLPLEMVKPVRPFDLHIRVLGERAFVSESSFMRFQTRDITWRKLEGNLWTHSCLRSDLTNRSLTHIPSNWSQNLVAEWQTWMGMHGTPGHILFKGDGCQLHNVEEIPAELRRAIESVTPGGLAEKL